jgi:hypothetical protein
MIWAKFQDGLAHPLNGSLQMDSVPVASPPGQEAPHTSGDNPPSY